MTVRSLDALTVHAFLRIYGVIVAMTAVMAPMNMTVVCPFFSVNFSFISLLAPAY